MHTHACTHTYAMQTYALIIIIIISDYPQLIILASTLLTIIFIGLFLNKLGSSSLSCLLISISCALLLAVSISAGFLWPPWNRRILLVSFIYSHHAFTQGENIYNKHLTENNFPIISAVNRSLLSVEQLCAISPLWIVTTREPTKRI